MVDNVKYLKTGALMILLLIQSISIGAWFYNFTLEQQYFNLTLDLFLRLGVLLILISYTYALTIAAWNKWFQFALLPLPVALGTSIIIATISPLYGALVFCTTYALLVYNTISATKMKKLLITFTPTLTLRYIIKGLLLSLAVTGAVFMLINTDAYTFDPAEELAESANEQIQNVIEQDEDISLIMQSGFFAEPDITNVLTNEINTFIEPYRMYITPVLAIITLGTLQFVNVVIYAFFALTVNGLFALAYKTRFIKKTTETVEKEVLQF